MPQIIDPQKNWDEFFKSIDDEMKRDAEKLGEKEGAPGTKKTGINFNLKPEELESYLNKFVVGQEESIEIIATKVCTHFSRMKLEQNMSEDSRILGNIKSNIMMIGPTGVGKTYIVKLIAKKIGVPFVKADATKFSETGYVGGDVEDLVRELVHEADGDIAKAEYGIIYLDEIDKIASSGNTIGPDVSRTGVQRNLLKLMEEADVDLKTPHDLASQVEAAIEAQRTGTVKRKKINTKNILFIVSGAFNGLDKIILRRLNYQAIGFDSNRGELKKDNFDILKQVKTEDMIEYGFESEFIGRLPITVVLNDVDENVLFQILKNKYSTVVNGKIMDFKSYGIDLRFEDEALRLLARKASTEKTGARGLLTVFEKTLIKFEKTLPSLGTKSLTVTGEVVQNPEKCLMDIMVTDSIKWYQKNFLINHGIYLEFEQEAVDLLTKKAIEEKKSLTRICEDLFHDYPYGIKLMKIEKFMITADAVKNPSEYIEKFIKEHYKPEE